MPVSHITHTACNVRPLNFCFEMSKLYLYPPKVLNVAEKNDAAKNIAGLLSGGTRSMREGYSKFNKIYEFKCRVQG